MGFSSFAVVAEPSSSRWISVVRWAMERRELQGVVGGRWSAARTDGTWTSVAAAVSLCCRCFCSPVSISVQFPFPPFPINQALGCVVACLVLFFRTRSCASLLGKSMPVVVLVLAVALAVAGVVSTETLFVKSSQLSWSSQSIVRAAGEVMCTGNKGSLGLIIVTQNRLACLRLVAHRTCPRFATGHPCLCSPAHQSVYCSGDGSMHITCLRQILYGGGKQ